MTDDNTKFTLLFQKSEKTEKTRQRLFVFLLIIPILYYLIDQAVILEINLSIFSIKQIRVLQLVTPPIYSVIFFYIAVLTEHNGEIIDEINKLIQTKQGKFDKWTKYIYPLNFIGEVLGNIRAGGCIGMLGMLIVFFPFIVLLFLYPITFFIYSIYYNFKNKNLHADNLHIWTSGFAIWITISNIIYLKSKLHGKKVQEEKSKAK